MIHFNGFEASIFWCVLDPTYLAWIHEGGDFPGESAIMKQTKPRSLLHPKSRTEFIEEFLWIVKYISEGRGGVGYLRQGSTKIHREIDVESRDILYRPQFGPQSEETLLLWRNNDSNTYSA
jgi:hypothetical protein